MKWAVAIAALLCAAPTASQDVAQTGPNTEYFSGWPPANYANDFAAVTLFVSNVETYCGPAPEGLVKMGCAWTRSDGTPVVVVPHPRHFPGEVFARILAHEGGHVQGWPKDHPL